MDDPASLTVRVPASTGTVAVRVWPAAECFGARHPVLLAFHDWTDSAEAFAPLATALRRRWTVVAPDAPGHGTTCWPPGPQYSVPDHLNGALAVLDALPEVNRRRAPVVVLGHAMGALTAARLAAARPGAVVHAVLEEPVRTTPRRLPSSALTRRWLDRLQAGDHAGRVAYLHREHPDWPADEHDPWARGKARTDPAHLDAEVVWGPSLQVLLSDVRCPVTIIHGDPARGGIMSPTAAARCTAVCAGGAEVIAVDAGHSPRREARDRFVAALTDVLCRH